MYQVKELPFALKAENVMECLNISRSAAYALMKRKDFPTITIGKSKRVKAEDFLKWVEQQKEVSHESSIG
ncbi:helix-turn-helix domain-containing protein [Bacillus pseudomycoides]|uniref:Helix-turn-helix domain-containing protein n=1 Tax=Bacillus bingmayongensis TaxID=1150157 RepID=A0ABU5JYE2_9BACI|nr:helix-turn-helix domain-containing protein [Bacillus pseudomycoides]